MTHTDIKDIVARRLRLDAMPPGEERDALLAKAMDVLAQRIFVDLLPVLNDEDRYVLKDLMTGSDSESAEIERFLRSLMERYADAVQQSVQAFFGELSTVADAANDAAAAAKVGEQDNTEEL